MSIIKVLLLIVVIALVSPISTCVFDALCWFYSSSTCTGLVYDGTRFLVMFAATMSAMLLMVVIVG